MESKVKLSNSSQEIDITDYEALLNQIEKNVEDNKLEIRPVSVAFSQGNLVVLESGLEAGDRIVTSDLVPVISGLPIKAIEVEEESQQFVKEAAGVIN